MMNKTSHFDCFWDNSIYPSIQCAINDMDSAFCAEGEVTIRDMHSYKTELEDIYRRKREWLKQSYLPHVANPCLDFHKLAAIVCRSIIGLKPIGYNIDAVEQLMELKGKGSISHNEQIKWYVNNVYVNYKIAYLSAVGIVYANLLYWGISKRDSLKEEKMVKIYHEFVSKLEKMGHLSSYQDPQAHENFENSMVIALMKNDLLQRDFDYLSLATNLYQLEYHTKVMLFQSILKNHEFELEQIDLS